jgi:nitrite reductase/ring-hydroxylating ferredoxin subunit
METYDLDPYPVGWYLAAFSDEVEPESVFRAHYFGQELVLFRGESGTVVTTEAYCPHQGAHLGWGGKVQGDEIVCPFHSWRFGPDGANTNVPGAQPDRGARLRTWPTTELDGMIFVWYHPDQAAPTWEVPPIPEFGQPDFPPAWRSEPIELTVSLQDTFENGVDAAHFVSVHRAFRLPTVNILLNEGPHFVAELPGQKLRSDRGPFDADVTSDLWGLGIDIARMKSGFMHIIYAMLQTPVDEERIRVHFHITVKRLSSQDPGEESPEFVAKVGAGIVAEFRQDKVIWDHKIYRSQPRLADYEGTVREYRRWARQFYPSQAGAPAATA